MDILIQPEIIFMSSTSFSDFSLSKTILTALAELGYENPTPIQAHGIPILLQGDDLMAQAQTGTGKTAAFALPILSKLDYAMRAPQAVILAPTRELAIQVANAFKNYAKHIPGFSVTPIYGGQDFKTQLRSLKKGSHVLVGTPGRFMDHLRRKSISLEHIRTVVLDEADEMLKMGFAEDVEWILGHLKHAHQTALFSATLPAPIQKLAQQYLKNAKKIHIQSKTHTVETLDQFYVIAARDQKFDLLTRVLTAEETQGVIVFARTKKLSSELSEKLSAQGFIACALNGDMSQSAREKTIERLKSGKIDILVATDVAARGIDISRVSHVINYDIPYSVDSYVHRVGRTGRAGRSGKAILFVTPREQHLLRDIERHIKKNITRMEAPSLRSIHDKRATQLQEKIVLLLQNEKYQHQLEEATSQIQKIIDGGAVSATAVAAALLIIYQALPSLEQAKQATEKRETRHADRDFEHDRKPRHEKSEGHFRKRTRSRFRGKFRGK